MTIWKSGTKDFKDMMYKSIIQGWSILIWSLDILIIIFIQLQDGFDLCIENLSDEMKEDYLLSVKKAIGKQWTVFVFLFWFKLLL